MYIAQILPGLVEISQSSFKVGTRYTTGKLKINFEFVFASKSEKNRRVIKVYLMFRYSK